MFFVSFSECSARFTNVFFLAVHHCTIKSIYHPTPLEKGIFVLRDDLEVSDDFAYFEVHLYAMFAADVFTYLN